MKRKTTLSRKLAQIEILGAELALELPKNTNAVDIINAGRDLNTRFSEYSPSVTRDGNTVYFVGFGKDNEGFNDEGVIELSEDGLDYHAKIFTAKKDDNGWTKPAALDPKIKPPRSPQFECIYFSGWKNHVFNEDTIRRKRIKGE